VTIGLTGPFTTTGSAAVRAAVAVGDAAVGAVEVAAVDVGVATAVDVADRVVPSNVAVLYASLSIFTADACGVPEFVHGA